MYAHLFSFLLILLVHIFILCCFVRSYVCYVILVFAYNEVFYCHSMAAITFSEDYI